MVKVSVIVPVFKVPEKFIRECFNSLSAQTLQDSEFVVVSDGAPEKECSICEEFAAKDSRFKFFKRDHAGVSSTRNFGISQASGEYITFVDSDDWIESNFCKALYTFAKKNDSDVLLFDFNPVGNQFKKDFFAKESKKNLSLEEISEICKECICLTQDRFVGAVSTICKLMKKDLITKNNIRFAHSITIAEDRPFSFTLFTKAKKISYINKCLYNYNLNVTSATHKINNRSFPNITAHLLEIHQSSPKYDTLICTCVVEHFFRSWQTYYFNKENKEGIKQSIQNLCEIVHSKKYNYYFNNVDLRKFPFCVKLEILFLRHQNTFLIWLHGIKHSISKLFK